MNKECVKYSCVIRHHSSASATLRELEVIDNCKLSLLVYSKIY